MTPTAARAAGLAPRSAFTALMAAPPICRRTLRGRCWCWLWVEVVRRAARRDARRARASSRAPRTARTRARALGVALRACRLQRRAEAPRRALLVAPVWPPARDQNLASARCRRARTCAGRRVSGIPRWPEGHSLRGSEVVAVECGAELGVRYDAHCFLQSAAAFNFRGLGGRFWSASGLQLAAGASGLGLVWRSRSRRPITAVRTIQLVERSSRSPAPEAPRAARSAIWRSPARRSHRHSVSACVTL